jgi:hypothetical protein
MRNFAWYILLQQKYRIEYALLAELTEFNVYVEKTWRDPERLHN